MSPGGPRPCSRRRSGSRPTAPDLVVDLTTARLLLLIRLSRFGELEAAAESGAAAMAAAHRPDQAFAGLVTAACGLAQRETWTAPSGRRTAPST